MLEQPTVPNISPDECARQLLDDVRGANNTPVAELVEITYVRLALLLYPGVKTVVGSPRELHYVVSPEAAMQISVAASGNRTAFDMLAEICRANVYSGLPVPIAMRALCSLIIAGEKTPPPQRGPKPGKRFGLFFISYLLAKYISAAYDVPLIRGDGYDECSAADVVCEALLAHGVTVSYTQIRDYLSHGKHAASRTKAHWMREMMYEPFLAELGLIAAPRSFGLSPFGHFLPMGRIT